MKKLLIPIFIFFLSILTYFAVATSFTFHPKWVLDYYNPLTQAILQGHFDLREPSETYDLAFFQGRWYAPWGMLPTFLLAPVQIIMGRYVPTIYLSVLFAGFNIVLIYGILLRLKRDFLPKLSHGAIFSLVAFFALGTTQFYVGTLGSVWHVDQNVSNFLGILGLSFVFKKGARTIDYIASSWIFALSLLGRPTISFLIIFPLLLYVWENFRSKKITIEEINKVILKSFLIFAIPLGVFATLFFFYNYARFNNPFEYGYTYIRESSYLADLRHTYGIISLRNIPRNLRYMLLEVPSLSYNGKFNLFFNLNGNSIFFLSPPFLSIFLANPLIRRRKKISADPYICALWVTLVATLLPSLALYSSGWMQFGYRYSLDITSLLLLLSVFGVKGKLNVLYFAGIIFSIFIYFLGIRALM